MGPFKETLFWWLTILAPCGKHQCSCFQAVKLTFLSSSTPLFVLSSSLHLTADCDHLYKTEIESWSMLMYDEGCRQERCAHFRLDVSAFVALLYLSYEVVCRKKYKQYNTSKQLKYVTEKYLKYLKFKKRLILWTCGCRCVSGHGHPVAGLPPEPHRQMSELHGRLPGSVSRHQGLFQSRHLDLARQQDLNIY